MRCRVVPRGDTVRHLTATQRTASGVNESLSACDSRSFVFIRPVLHVSALPGFQSSGIRGDSWNAFTDADQLLSITAN